MPVWIALAATLLVPVIWIGSPLLHALKKLIEYVNLYKEENSLDDEESELLISFFKDCLDRKKFQRVKDVIYDKSTGLIKEIPALSYIKATKHFTLKNIDKRITTQKSLPTKKTQGTIKNKSIPIKINEE